MLIRDATPADAPEACDVLRASISELCAADHDSDPEILKSLARQQDAGECRSLG